MNTVKFDKKDTLVIAHRGLSGIEPENTSSSFIAAGNRSYYGIETDIHRTADGYLLINHDGNLKRIAGVDLAVEESDLDTLQKIILFDKDGSNTRPDIRPIRLEDYVKICKRYEKHSVIELKSEFTGEDIAKIIEIVKNESYLENTTFISFKYENLLKIRRLLPRQSAQFLFKEFSDGIIEALVRDRLDADVYFGGLSEEIIAKLHAAGIKVNCWTVDDPEVAARLAEWGVDYITSNILE